MHTINEETQLVAAVEWGTWAILPDWEREQFAIWYSEHPEHWGRPTECLPFNGIPEAHHAWLRRP